MNTTKFNTINTIDKYLRISILFFSLFSIVQLTFAATASSQILKDINGDGKVNMLCFGDSLTFGVGGENEPGKVVFGFENYSSKNSFTSKISNIAGIPTINVGIPGEVLVPTGTERFPGAVLKANSDIVLIFEGLNDARYYADNAAFQASFQKVINVASSLGKTVMIATFPPPCCGHGFFQAKVLEYSNIIKELALVNNIPLVDFERAWRTTCVNVNECELFNIPEGLHPNSQGYTVLSQVILAKLYGIDIFKEGGAKELQDALGLADGSVLVKPGL